MNDLADSEALSTSQPKLYSDSDCRSALQLLRSRRIAQ